MTGAIKSRPFSRGNPDPKHHNYGRAQNFNQQLSTRLAWLSLTLKGNSVNIFAAVTQVKKLLLSAEGNKLPVSVQSQLNSLLIDAKTLAARTNELAAELKELNANKRYMK